MMYNKSLDDSTTSYTTIHQYHESQYGRSFYGKDKGNKDTITCCRWGMTEKLKDLFSQKYIKSVNMHTAETVILLRTQPKLLKYILTKLI